MADQAHPVGLDVQAQFRLQRGEDVFPDRVAGAGVVEADRLVEVLGFQRVQIGPGLRGDRLLGPAGGQRGTLGELLQGQRAANAQVVVAGQAHGRVAAGQLDAGVGVCPVAD